MKKLLLLLLLCANVFAAKNWFSDTVNFVDTLENNEYEYGKAVELSDGEDIRLVFLVDDTSEAGFGSDSVNLEWGFQTGTVVYNANGLLDTAWDARIIVDTMVTGSYALALTDGKVDSSGALARTWAKEADTANVTGFAVQSRWIVPEWDVLYRPFAKGITGNKLASALKATMTLARRRYVSTRGQ